MRFTVFPQKKLVTFYSDTDKKQRIGQLTFSGTRQTSRVILAETPLLLPALCTLNNEYNKDNILTCIPDTTFDSPMSDKIFFSPSLPRNGIPTLYAYRNGEQVGSITSHPDMIKFNNNDPSTRIVQRVFWDFVRSLSKGVYPVPHMQEKLRTNGKNKIISRVAVATELTPQTQAAPRNSVLQSLPDSGEDLSLHLPGSSLNDASNLPKTQTEQGKVGELKSSQLITAYDSSIYQLHSIRWNPTSKTDLDHLLLSDFGIILIDSKKRSNSCYIKRGQLYCGSNRIMPNFDGPSPILYENLQKSFPELKIPIYKAIIVHAPKPQEAERDELMFTNFDNNLFENTTIRKHTLFTYAERFASDDVLGRLQPVLPRRDIRNVFNTIRYSGFWLNQ